MDGHKVEGCQGRWIDVGTLREPWKQVCAGCRATRQKPVDEDELDETTITAAEERHVRGLQRLRSDLEDDLHQDDGPQPDASAFRWFIVFVALSAAFFAGWVARGL